VIDKPEVILDHLAANVGNAQPTRCAFGWSFIKVASPQSSSAAALDRVGVRRCRQTSHGHDGNRRNAGRDDHWYLVDSRDLLRRRAFCRQSQAARTARRAPPAGAAPRLECDFVCSDKAPRRLARAEPLFPQERVSPVPWLANPSGGCTTADGSCRKRCGASTCPHLAHHREPRLHLDHHPLFATVLLQVAIQTVSVLNQIRLFVVDVNARSRLNTAFMSSNLIGGAISSSLAGALWQSGGWFSLTAGAAVLIGLR
jgi:hypothetical protein